MTFSDGCRIATSGRYWMGCVAKLKNEGGEKFAICPSKWIFGDTMPCNELTKAAG
jgi:hypothetical protein